MKLISISSLFLLLFALSTAQSFEVSIDKYSLNFVDGYGWKEVNVPPAIKDKNNTKLAMFFKDKGQKTIMVSILDSEKVDLQIAAKSVLDGMKNDKKMTITETNDIQFNGRNAVGIVFNKKNPDDDEILGHTMVFQEFGKTIALTKYSGFVNPYGDEEMDTILSTLKMHEHKK